MMNYKEFKDTYNFATKKYPNTYNLPYDRDIFICDVTKVRQVKKGNKWKDEERIIMKITTEKYMNIIEAIPFFRNLGGTETVSQTYTRYGKIPSKIISTSPDKVNRSVYIFSF